MSDLSEVTWMFIVGGVVACALIFGVTFYNTFTNDYDVAACAQACRPQQVKHVGVKQCDCGEKP